MKISWLDEQSSWVVVLALMTAMLASAEIGYRFGERRHELTGETGRGHFNLVQAALLGLLALLLGFTFNMSSLRYEARRQLVVDDANAIVALDLQSRFLPDPQGANFRRLLRQYVDLRTDTSAIKRDLFKDALAGRIAQAEILHRRMWDLVQAEVQSDHTPKGVDGLVPLLSDTLSIQSKRMNAYESRVPDTILVLLFGAAIMASTAVGYSSGLARHRGVLAATMMTFLVGGTVYAILDLDQPAQGFSQIEQAPLLRVKQQIEQETLP